MAQPGFIFGQGTADSYESLQAKRRTAERLGLAAMRTPQNLGEGLSSLGQAIAYRRLMNQADAGDAAGRAAYDEKRPSVLGSLMGNRLGGAPFNPSIAAPITANPAGLDPSIIKAVDRVNPQEAEIRAGLIERGMAPHIADGFVMNFKDESGLDPGINEAAPIVPGSRGGFGLAQWTGPRRVALEKFAAERGAAPSDANVQMDFLMTELQGPESRAASSIFAAPDAGSAAAAIATDFLRPAPEHLSRRVAEYTGGQMNPGASIPALMELLSDPYAPQGDKMILGALLEQQLAQMQPPDPMQALDMEYKRAQIDQMRAPQMAGPPQVETFYDEATGQPYKAERVGQDWVRVGGVQAADGPMVDMSGLQIGGAGEVGTIPQGYELFTDPATGARRLQPLAGGPEDASKSTAAAESAASTGAEVILSAAARARQAASGQNFGAAGTSVVGQLPWTDSAEVLRQVATLKANGTVAALTAMRAASPTGAALGAASDKDLALLAAKAGTLDPNSPNFQRDLDDYELTLLRTIYGKQKGDAEFAKSRGTATTGGAAPSLGLSPEDMQWLEGN